MKNVRTFSGPALFGLCAFALSSCASVPLPTLKSIYTARLSYDTVFLPAAVNYRRLKRCASGIKFTVASPCSNRSVIVKLMKADRIAEKALNDAESFVRANAGSPIGATLIDTASFAVSEAVSLITPYLIR